MQHNKTNILYTTIAVIIIVATAFFVAIASVFWISLYLEILLILKIRRVGGNKITTHQLN